MGSAQASMRSTVVARSITSLTLVIQPISTGAANQRTASMKVMTSMPPATHLKAMRRATSLRPAPILCPTSVVAASLTPYPGI